MADEAVKNPHRRDYLVRVPPKRTKKLWRDWKAENTARGMRRLPLFADMPKHLVVGFCQLYNLSYEVRDALHKHGVVDEHGKPSWLIDKYARLKEGERRYLQTMIELAAQMRQSQQPAELTAALAPPVGWKPTLMDIKQAFMADGALDSEAEDAIRGGVGMAAHWDADDAAKAATVDSEPSLPAENAKFEKIGAAAEAKSNDDDEWQDVE